MTMTALQQHYMHLFSAQTAQDSTLQKMRNKALNQFLQQGFPTTRLEHWKYTAVKPLEMHLLKPANGDQINLPATSLISPDYYTAVFINGYFAPHCSHLAMGNGIEVKNLSTALQEKKELLLSSFSADTQNSSFTNFNLAFLQDGLYVEIADNTQLDKPLHLVFLSQPNVPAVMQQTHNIIVCGKNSQASIIEHYVGTSENFSLTNTISRIQLDENSHLNYCVLQDESRHTFHIAQINVIQQANSQFNSYSFDFGSQLCRRELRTTLAGPGSECNLNGLYIADKNQHLDNHTFIDHKVPHGTSRELYKGILQNKSRAVFNGKITVFPDAQKASAILHNFNLLLSNDAEVDTKPELEIFADDVQCAHGATIGQLDADALFYLASRGLSLELAKDILLYGFASEIIHTVPEQACKRYIDMLLMKKMPAIAADLCGGLL